MTKIKSTPKNIYYERQKERRKTPYRVRVDRGGIAHNVGRFATLEEAVIARDDFLKTADKDGRISPFDRPLIMFGEHVSRNNYKFEKIAGDVGIDKNKVVSMVEDGGYVINQVTMEIYKKI